MREVERIRLHQSAVTGLMRWAVWDQAKLRGTNTRVVNACAGRGENSDKSAGKRIFSGHDRVRLSACNTFTQWELIKTLYPFENAPAIRPVVRERRIN